MCTSLVIFTETYPYYPGEPFLQAEVSYLAGVFENITIVPRYDGADANPRELPANVACLQPLMGVKPSKFKRAIAGVCNLATLRPFLINVVSEKPWKSLSRFRSWLLSCLLIRIYLSNSKVRKQLNRDDCNFYFYWGNPAAAILPFANIKGHKVARFHGIDLYKERLENRGYIPFQKLVVNNLDTIIAISKNGKEYLEANYPHVHEKTHLCRLGVEDAGISKASEDGVFRIVSCSNLIPVKRVELIAEALANVDAEVRWSHFGDGPSRVKVESLICNLPANVKSHFYGRVENRRVREHYAQNPIDLFINVSSNEGVPVSIMEALSAGIPVFATAAGGTAELVDDSVGRLLDVDFSVEDLTTEIKSFMDMPSFKVMTMRKSARERWDLMADAEKQYSQFADFLSFLDGKNV